MADETKTSLNFQSLAQFLTIAVVLITCAVAIERRLTTLEIGQNAPLSEKQKEAIREYVDEVLKRRNITEGEDVQEEKPKPRNSKPAPRKPKITGQLGPLRATEPYVSPNALEPHSRGN